MLYVYTYDAFVMQRENEKLGEHFVSLPETLTCIITEDFETFSDISSQHVSSFSKSFASLSLLPLSSSGNLECVVFYSYRK